MYPITNDIPSAILAAFLPAAIDMHSKQHLMFNKRNPSKKRSKALHP